MGPFIRSGPTENVRKPLKVKINHGVAVRARRKMNYNEILRESANKTGNIVCMGLDPVLEVLPFPELPSTERILTYMRMLFTEMKAKNLVPAAFKPNIGYYAILDKPRKGDFSGSMALSGVLDLLEEFFPGIPVIKAWRHCKEQPQLRQGGFRRLEFNIRNSFPIYGNRQRIPIRIRRKGYVHPQQDK